MSIKLMAEAWGTSGLTTAQKITLLCICDFANDEGYCWPRIKTIANKCDIGERAVQYNISHLTKMGIVEVLPRHITNELQAANLYWISFAGERDNSMEKSLGYKDRGEKYCTLENTGLPNIGVHGGAPGGVHGGAPKEPSYKNHQKPLLSENLFGEEEQIPRQDPLQNRFEEFWAVYPRHDGKAQAEKAWGKIISKKWKYDVVDYIIKAVENQKKSKAHLLRTEKQHIPLPATWLNGERWLDEVQVEMENLYVR